MSNHEEKWALVTGGGQRIGASLAEALAEWGYHIVLHYRSSHNEALQVKERIERRGRQCKMVCADLCDEAASLRFAEEQLDGIDLLLNNASLYYGGGLDSDGPDLLNTMIAIHLKAPYFFLHYLAKRGKKAHVINMLDAQTSKNECQHFAYTLSKNALTKLTLMAAKQLAPVIRVNGIALGPILYPAGSTPKQKEKVDRTSNVIQGLQYLLENDFVAGEILTIDGGINL